MPLGGLEAEGSGAAITSRGVGALDIFMVATDKRLYQRSVTGGTNWTGWINHGGPLAGRSAVMTPAAASWKGGSCELAARGSDGQVYVKSWYGSNWSNWEVLGDRTDSTIGGCGVIARKDRFFGDWNGDGVQTPGIQREGVWLLRNSNTTGEWNVAPFGFGSYADQPIVGDWDGNGTTTVGYRHADPVNHTSTFYLRNSNTSGNADYVFAYGLDTDEVLVGDWDGNGTQTIGIRRGTTFALRNSNSSGAPDIAFNFGDPNDEFFVGDWEGDRVETVGQKHGNKYFLKRYNDGSSTLAATFTYGRYCDAPLAVRLGAGLPAEVTAVRNRREWFVRNSSSSFHFPTPVVLQSEELLAPARARVSAYVEPYWSAFYKVQQNADPNSVLPPPYQGLDYLTYWDTARTQAMTARDAALSYKMGSSPAYAAKARQILLAWANDPARLEADQIATVGDPQNQYPTVTNALVISRPLINFADAYAMVHSTFTETERNQVEAWLGVMAAEIIATFDEAKSLNWPMGPFSNQLIINMASRVAAGLALGDDAMVHEALYGSSNPKNFFLLMNGSVLRSCSNLADCKTILSPNDPTLKAGAPYPWNGEMWDRCRSSEKKGLGYSLLSAKYLTLASEMSVLSGAGRWMMTATNATGQGLYQVYDFYAPF